MKQKKLKFHEYMIKFEDDHGNYMGKKIIKCFNIEEAKRETKKFIQNDCSGITRAIVTRIYKKENRFYV